MKEKLVDLIDKVSDHIEKNNKGLDISEHLIKIGFLREMILNGEVKSLTQLVAFCIYVSDDESTKKVKNALSRMRSN